MIVVDASAMVAALIDGGPEGAWALEKVLSASVASAHLMPAEVAQTLRREASRRNVSDDVASMAHADLATMPVELFPYLPFATRVWELRRTITAYDAWYVALAEVLDAPLVTLDRKLARAAGPRCAFDLPPGRG